MTKEVTLKYTSTDEYWDLKWRLIKKALRAFMWLNNSPLKWEGFL